MQNNSIVVLVSSFDGFADCWEPLIYSFEKYWSGISYPAYLMTNKKNSPKENVIKALKVGQDKGWASNMIAALREIDVDYIIYMQDDYWLDQYIDTKKIASIIDRVIDNNWDYFRLVPIPGADQIITGQDYGYTNSHSKYQVSLQAAIWKKEFLLTLLNKGDSGWDFENNTRNSLLSLNAKTLSVANENFSIMSYCSGTAIRKGKWTLGAKEFIEKEGLNFDLTKRKIETKFENWLLRISGKNLLFKIVGYGTIRTIQVFKKERSFRSLFKL